MAGQIDGPAPLPGGPVDARLAKLLVLAQGREKGHGDLKECPAPGGVGSIIPRFRGAFLP